MEESVIQRAQKGDQRAFQHLVETYNDVAWRTARVLLAERALAEDALQEAWLDAWRGLSRFRLQQSFRPWLLTIVANRCRMMVRRHALPTVPFEPDDVGGLINADDVLKQILHLERDAELRTALGQLSKEQQQILELRFFAELELAEIALITGIPLGTVKSRLHRALGALRVRFQAAQPVEMCMEKEK